MARFLFRAQDHNMTNGDFAFITFEGLRSLKTDQPWTEYGLYVDDSEDLPRRRRAFVAVKQVHGVYLPNRIQLNITVHLLNCR